MPSVKKVRIAGGRTAIVCDALIVTGADGIDNTLVFDSGTGALLPGPSPGGGGGGSDFTTPLTVTIADSSSPTVNTLGTFTARRTTPAGTGFGAAILFQLDDDSNAITDAARIDAIWIDPSGSCDSSLSFRVRTAGGALAETMRVANENNVAFGDACGVIGPGISGLLFGRDYGVFARDGAENWHQLLYWDGTSTFTIGDDVSIVHRSPSRSFGGSTVWLTGATLLMQLDDVSHVVNLPMSVGTNADPAASLVLDVVSTTKGAALPRMTTTERDLISSPEEGSEIWNLTTKRKNIFNGTTWKSVAFE